MTEELVRISPSCSMSMSVASPGPSVPEEVVAVASVKVTVPKSAKSTREPPEEKSSTIHSALSSSRALLWPLKVWVTVSPVLTFSITAVPPVVEVAVTVAVIVSPAEMVMPLKS